MNSKRLIILSTILASIIFSGCTQTSTKTYTSDEYNFSLEYPASWQFTDGNNGIVFSANDEADEWGGTNLNLQYNFEAGDVGMGWKEFKNEQFVNPNGVDFDLSYNSADPDFGKEFDVVSDPNDVNILIGNESFPGLKMFSYDKQVNPNGEAQLREILMSLKKF